MYLTKRVELYKKTSNDLVDWEDTPQIIEDAFNVRVTNSLADKKDSFSFQIVNVHSKYKNAFEVGDNVKIYFGQNSNSFTITDNLAIDGIINSLPEEVDDKGKVLTISGTSRTEFLLSASVIMREISPLTPPQLAQAIIREVNRYLTNGRSRLSLNFLPLTDSFTDESTQNPAKRSDNTAHSTFPLVESDKQASVLLDRISLQSFTKDSRGSYIYWLDNQNNFHFRWRNATVAATITEGSTNGPRMLKVNKSMDNVANFLILQCGTDPNGKGIRTRIYDAASITRYGRRTKMIISTSTIATEIMQNEVENKPTNFNNTDGFVPTSFPYTTFWTSKKTDNLNAPTVTAGVAVTCTSKAQFVAAIRREAKWRAEDIGRGILLLYANPRYKATAEFPRTMDYTTADLIILNANTYNVQNKLLRLREIQYDDFTTTLTLEEDDTTILSIAA